MSNDRQPANDRSNRVARAFNLKNIINWILFLIFIGLLLFYVLYSMGKNNLIIYHRPIRPISTYFRNLEKDGSIVTTVDYNVGESSGHRFREIWIWNFKNSTEENWESAAWILLPYDPETVVLLEELQISEDNFWAGNQDRSGGILLPMNSTALDIHVELDLHLPSASIDEIMTDLREYYETEFGPIDQIN